MERKTIYLTEEQYTEIYETALREALIVNIDLVKMIVKYLNKHFKPIKYDDINADGDVVQPYAIQMLSMDGEALQTISVDNLLSRIDSVFHGKIRNNEDRHRFYKQIIDDWLAGKVSKEGVLSVNVIKEAKTNHILTESDTRMKRFEDLVRSRFDGKLNLSGPVSGPEYYVNGNPQTTWFQYIVFNFRHHFGLMSNADVKYLYPFALIAYSDEVGFDMRDDNEEQVSNLTSVIRICKQHPEYFEKYIKNGTTYEQMMQVFGPMIEEIHNNMENELQNTNFDGRSDYEILKDVDYSTANKYGKYSCSSSILCFTNNKTMWETFTNNGKNKCYLCLKKGWEDIPERHDDGSNSAYDTYGLSMIFVFVTPEGDIYHSNTRWNHSADYPGHDVDNAFDWLSLSKVLGINAKNAMPGYSEEELKAKGIRYVTFENVQKMLASGVSPKDIFDWIGNFSYGFWRVELNGKWNYISTDVKLLSPNQWFDEAYTFSDGFGGVELNGKCNYISVDGKLLSPNQWFNDVYSFSDGFGQVRLNDKWNFISTDGKLLSPNQWFDRIHIFSDGFGEVELNGKWNFISADGKLLSPNQWFDGTGRFSNGFGRVALNDKINYISVDGKLLSQDQWFDDAWPFDNGFGQVKLNGRRFYIDKNGRLYDYRTMK